MRGQPKAEGSFAALRQLARRPAPIEICEFCSALLETIHRHLFEIANRNIICACPPCALRFANVSGGRFKLIPRDAHFLPDFHLTDEQWNSFALPINLAFFFNSTAAGKITAYYPSPAGAMESLLAFRDWKTLLSENAALAQMQPDVEALLVNRVGDAREYFIAPIDACFELVGLVRTHWRGLSGGEEAWVEIQRFFRELKERSVPVTNEVAYA